MSDLPYFPAAALNMLPPPLPLINQPLAVIYGAEAAIAEAFADGLLGYEELAWLLQPPTPALEEEEDAPHPLDDQPELDQYDQTALDWYDKNGYTGY